MNNAQILSNSINEWISPIIEKGFQGLANQNQLTFMLSNLITPDRLLKVVQEHLSIPFIYEQVSKLPDAIIPDFSLDVIDGMIQTRMEKGALEIPMIGIRLTPDAFRNLRSICQKNFEAYGTPAEESSSMPSSN